MDTSKIRIDMAQHVNANGITASYAFLNIKGYVMGEIKKCTRDEFELFLDENKVEYLACIAEVIVDEFSSTIAFQSMMPACVGAEGEAFFRSRMKLCKMAAMVAEIVFLDDEGMYDQRTFVWFGGDRYAELIPEHDYTATISVLND